MFSNLTKYWEKVKDYIIFILYGQPIILQAAEFSDKVTNLHERDRVLIENGRYVPGAKRSGLFFLIPEDGPPIWCRHHQRSLDGILSEIKPDKSIDVEVFVARGKEINVRKVYTKEPTQ